MVARVVGWPGCHRQVSRSFAWGRALLGREPARSCLVARAHAQFGACGLRGGAGLVCPVASVRGSYLFWVQKKELPVWVAPV